MEGGFDVVALVSAAGSSIAFLLHAAAGDGNARYMQTAEPLGVHVVAIAHNRVDAALNRLHSGGAAQFAEYDLFYGLTGMAAILLRTRPGSDATGRVLDCLVKLTTKPLLRDGHALPG